MGAATISLDQFELIEPIGEGGMGQVWRGKHRAQDVDVAVKVLTSVRANDDKVRAALRNEVRQAARLHHKNIITLFDQGEVSAKVAAGSYGELRGGSPYLAMEYLPGGTLSRLRQPMDWPLLRGLLLDILDALAHAHARGVIHRDLKPANVLLNRPGDLRHGVKISDFGIAHAMDSESHSQTGDSVSGTLRYMAPEQVLGHWRDEGPWTDLYALGVLAYRLATGAFPFGDAEGARLAHCHLHVPAPKVVGRIALPAGFHAWVDRLLAKRPINRFDCAADAAFALQQLGPAVDAGDKKPPMLGSAEITVDALPADFHTEVTATSSSTRLQSRTWTVDEDVQPPAPAPPVPDSWRRSDVGDLSMQLVGAGLGLYGLRPVPMIARHEQRDVLWASLRGVVRQQASRMVAVYGSAGCGKTRLVQWIGQRAAELGAARVLRCSHSPIAGQADGLWPMFANALRCTGLDRAGVIERCHRFVTEHPLPDDAEDAALAIAELVAPPADDAGEARVRLATPADRYGAARRLLERMCLRRPVMLCFDDVQWGGDALEFAEFLLAGDVLRPLPILIAVTVRAEALSERPWERDQLEVLLARPNVTRVDVPPLSKRDHKTLVGRMLGLASGLVDEVATRTDGNPLFAVQLIGDWVERGLLQTAADGFFLRPGARPQLPDDLHELWTARVDHIAERFGDRAGDAVAALQLAAGLGSEVLYDEWYAACDLAGIGVPAGLLEQLWSFQLASAGDRSWSFTHGMLRESLERRACEAGRWQALHRACADMLASHYPAGSPGIAGRRGHHLVAAGALEAALEPLLAGAEARRSASDFHLAYALYAERERAMVALGLGDDDRRRADNDIRWARACVTQGQLEEATKHANAAEEPAVRFGWTDISAFAHGVHGGVALARGDISTCYEEFAQGVALFRKLDEPRGQAECLTGLGGVCYWKRDLDEATEHYEQAYELVADTGDLYELGIILRGLGNVRYLSGDTEKSAELLQRALSCFEQNGNRFNVASCQNDLGEIARGRGNLAAAEALYSQSAELYESLGCSDASTPRFNQGLLRLQRGKYDAARQLFETEIVKMARSERTLDLLWVHTGMVPCMAAEADWDGFDYHMQRVYDLLESIVDADIAYLTELAGNLAREAGEKVRAEQAYRIAVQQYQSIGDEEKVTTLKLAYIR